eukprot:15447887-Alexandrium_andersonii.AAC.1
MGPPVVNNLSEVALRASVLVLNARAPQARPKFGSPRARRLACEAIRVSIKRVRNRPEYRSHVRHV